MVCAVGLSLEIREEQKKKKTIHFVVWYLCIFLTCIDMNNALLSTFSWHFRISFETISLKYSSHTPNGYLCWSHFLLLHRNDFLRFHISSQLSIIDFLLLFLLLLSQIQVFSFFVLSFQRIWHATHFNDAIHEIALPFFSISSFGANSNKAMLFSLCLSLSLMLCSLQTKAFGLNEHYFYFQLAYKLLGELVSSSSS